ncbi:hypothetical protein BX592_11536 [Paraburkholderia rhizosphaerae]|uniref:Uncharacterized protein n=1 Tax=Paraburkholderia rhizosphaerae TaxID=480658 RepID=A0A4R8LMP5_9BURK|nr:hypothetical protein BX592_11536 [Paraburkholderia rhizosphaerae]
MSCVSSLRSRRRVLEMPRACANVNERARAGSHRSRCKSPALQNTRLIKHPLCKSKTPRKPWRFALCSRVRHTRGVCLHGLAWRRALRTSLLACARSRSRCGGSSVARSRSRIRSGSSRSCVRSSRSRIRSGCSRCRFRSSSSRCRRSVVASCRSSCVVAALAACSKRHGGQQRCYEEGFLHDHVLLWLKVSNSANLPVMCSNTDPGRWWRRTS